MSMELDYERSAEILERYKQDNKERFEGKRCFIIGNGPSLKAEDLDKIRGEFSIASNRIYLIFDKTDWRPDVYTSLDLAIIKASLPEIIALKAELKLIVVEAIENIPEPLWEGNILPVRKLLNFDNWLATGKLPLFSDDITKCMYHGMTVTYFNIQTAVWLGFKEIILIGIDHQYKTHWRAAGSEGANAKVLGIPGRLNFVSGVEQNHFDPNYNDGLNGGVGGNGPLFWVDAATKAYMVAKKYADSHGIKIINATRGGKLEVFERVNFDRLMSSKPEAVETAGAEKDKNKNMQKLFNKNNQNRRRGKK